VRDTGHGIERGILPRIFEPLFTTKVAGEGTGMGLAVVRRIVVAHGGAITVASEPGVGTTFAVYLPEASGVPVDVPAPPALRPLGGGRLLVVDDDPAVLGVERQMLESLGYEVHAWACATDALAAFRQAPTDFAAVVTDQMMPDMTGEVLARELLRIRPDLPVVLCTGYVDALTPAQARAVGVREYLAKPVLVDELGDALHRVLGEQQGLRG
jgi:CheY-like chemotaxis protein